MIPDTVSNFDATRFSIHAYCPCGHHALLNVPSMPPQLRIVEIRERLRCVQCGARGPQVIRAYHGRIGPRFQQLGGVKV